MRIGSLVLVAAFYISFSLNAQTGWQSTSISTADDFKDVHFTSSSVGYAVGENSTYKMIKTTDAGSSWTSVSITYGTASLDFFYGYSNGFAATTGMFGYSTQDNGDNWALRNTIPVSPLDCNMSTSSIVWVAGYSGYVAKSTDQGVNWSTVTTTGNSYNYRSVFFYNQNYGWICGDWGTIVKTTNGGSNWTNVDLTTSGTSLYKMYSIFFISQTVGWCVGVYQTAPAAIFKTTDGGSTWTKYAQTLPNVQLNEVFFITASTGWAVGNSGTILSTTDGGSSWITQTSGTSNNLNSVYFYDASNGWIVGDEGTVLKTTDGGLPVELTSFNAISIENNIRLIWQTETESNNYGFEIERRTVKSEVSTENSYKKVGFVRGAGTCNTPSEYFFTDAKLPAGNYDYRLKQIDLDGSFKYSNSVEVSFIKPAEFSLHQNYPNPFNPTTKIIYEIPSSPFSEKGEQGGFVSLRVYDMLGREVITLVNEQQSDGNYEVELNASLLSSGMYFYRLDWGNISIVKKMLLLK